MSISSKITDEFIPIKAAFESGSIKKMSDLEKQKSTRIAKLIGMNQGRYGAKLLAPKNFSPSEIIRMSIVFDIDAGLIINVIKKELIQKELDRINKNIKRMKSKDQV